GGLRRRVAPRQRSPAPGSRPPLYSWPLSEPIIITLDSRPGRIEGRYKAADRGRLDGAPPLRLRLLPLYPGRKFRLAYSRRVEAGPDGSFQFDALPPGRYEITPELAADSRFLGAPLRNVAVGRGARVAGLEIALEPTVTITGRVVEAETGKGLAGIRVWGRPVASRTPPPSIPPPETDAEGRYHVRVARGKVQIRAG